MDTIGDNVKFQRKMRDGNGKIFYILGISIFLYFYVEIL